MPAETHTHGSSIDEESVLALVTEQLAEILQIDAEVVERAVTAGKDRLSEDLHADSIALFELVESLEDELSERSVGFEIESDDLEDLHTVRDIVSYVVARVG
ncbi:MAG TPA: phosphopantetheine-binding protein [Acidimicrobiaceae bacterium]|nr:phosphopantetheine-binding protein [Acidimicrobiaceae bacterium]